METSSSNHPSIHQVIPLSVLPALSPLSSEFATKVIEDSPNLHLLAKDNEASKIRAFTIECNILEVKRCCLTPDMNGNTPAMIAAYFNRKEALLALLGPFFTIPDDKDQIFKLLHHRNKAGQNILSLVSLHIDTLFAAHALLLEFEAAAHDWNSYQIRLCLRKNLGSTKEAMVSLSCLEKIEKRPQKEDRRQYQPQLFARFLVSIFLVKSIFYAADVITDVILVINYWNEWKNETFPAAHTKDLDLRRCTISEMQLPLNCYSQAISSAERFIGTLVLICAPFALYFFEMLRFRTFSAWIERKLGLDPGHDGLMVYFLKALVNSFVWILWPLISFFRYAFYLYKYEACVDSKKSETYKTKAQASQLASIRAHVIEVCIESSLQPLLQLYLVLISVYERTQIKEAEHRLISIDSWLEQLSNLIEYLQDKEIQRICSSLISILMIAVSYTTQYNHKKNQVLSAASTIVYFGYVLLSVISRILCFEMFAFYLGPGLFHLAFGAVLAHVLIMASFHLVMSDSLTTLKNHCSDRRQTLLILENCLVNGLANIYMHNNLNIFIRLHPAEDQSKKNAQQESSLIRQMSVDALILVENVIMLCLGLNTETSTSSFRKSYWIIVLVVTLSYTASMTLKILFYCYCHPWSKLIQPHRSGNDQDVNDAAVDICTNTTENEPACEIKVSMTK